MKRKQEGGREGGSEERVGFEKNENTNECEMNEGECE